MTNDKANFKAEIESVEVEFWQTNDGWQHLTETGVNSEEFNSLAEAIASAKEEVKEAINEYGELAGFSPEDTGEDSSWQSYDDEF